MTQQEKLKGLNRAIQSLESQLEVALQRKDMALATSIGQDIAVAKFARDQLLAEINFKNNNP